MAKKRKARSPLPTLGLVSHGVSALPFGLGLWRFFQHGGRVESRLDLLQWDAAGPCWLSGLLAMGLGAALISRPEHARWLAPLGVGLTFAVTVWGVAAVLALGRDATPLLTWLPILVAWAALAALVWRARAFLPAPVPEAATPPGAPPPSDAG